MKYLLFLMLTIQSFASCSQGFEIQQNEFINSINSEIDTFITQVQARSINDGQYQVYVIYIHEADYSSNKICFTLGHISNEDELDLIPSQYLLKRNGQFVLAIFDEALNQDVKQSLSELFTNFLREDESSEYMNIKNRLFRTSNTGNSTAPRGITYVPKGFVYCEKNGKASRQYIKDANEIPIEKSIYKYWPGGIIEELE